MNTAELFAKNDKVTVLGYFQAKFPTINVHAIDGIPPVSDFELGWGFFPLTSPVGVLCKELIDKGAEFLALCDGAPDFDRPPAISIIDVIVSECNVHMYG